MTRFLHPWFGLAFVFFFALQTLNWWQVMTGRRPTRAG
jgi:hypothetical protein